jgi:hypothetical protein
METAKDKSGKEIIILNYDKVAKVDAEQLQKDANNLTSDNIEGSDYKTPADETSELEHKDTVGICVSYKKRILDATFEGPGTKVLRENWCVKYDSACTSDSRDTTDPKCLYVQSAMKQASAAIKARLKNKENSDNRQALLSDLNKAVTAAEKLLKV